MLNLGGIGWVTLYIVDFRGLACAVHSAIFANTMERVKTNQSAATSTLSCVVVAAAAVLSLAACKPPPTDADMARDMPEGKPTYASDPLPSPDVEGAIWAESAEGERIIYGVPGQPALIALACIGDDADPSLRVTRISAADQDAGAMLALIGNGAIGRMEVDSTEINGRLIWQGEIPAQDERWEPLAGPRQVTVTVPGAGMVTLNPSPLPAQFLAECRGLEAPKLPDPELPAE